jgi:hypothetical protein
MNKQGKINAALVLVLLVGAVLFMIYVYPTLTKQTTETNSIMSYTLYDSNGNVIPKSTYAIVGGTSGVSSFTIQIKATNTGSIPLNISLTTLTPTAFNSAVTKTVKVVQPGQQGIWTSSQISASQFTSGTQPTVFTAALTGAYPGGSTTANGQLSLVIQPDATGSFTVSLSTTATGTGATCGDGTCTSPTETAENCPNDCAISGTKVKFRTTDATYPSGSAIAYSATCGGALTAYGDGGSSSGSCTTSGYTIVGTTKEGYNICTRSGYPTRLYVQAAVFRIYETGDADASKVSTSINPIDTTKEVTC